ncbi:MAG: hypothetical protein KC561_12370, partial [Myxococcales bacterium]|nr:hypothetical protein [Myxococcales bacterium]
MKEPEQHSIGSRNALSPASSGENGNASVLQFKRSLGGMPYGQQVEAIRPASPFLAAPAPSADPSVQFAEDPEAALTQWEWFTSVFDAPGADKPLFRLERGTRVSTDGPPSGEFVKIRIDGGVHQGKSGFIRAKSLQEETAAKDLKVEFEVYNVILIQATDSSEDLKKSDPKHREYYANIAQKLAASRPNTIGCNVGSGGLIPGAPTQYNTGADIVTALRTIGAALAQNPPSPGKTAKIGEIHIIGHSGSH